MNHSGGDGLEEARRWLDVALRLLGANDLVGSKRFAERALEAYPLLDGVDQILAVADVLLAAQHRVGNQINWYAVLQLTRPTSGPSAADDHSAVKRQYRHLALLLRSDRNKFPGADAALRLVVDAFAVLSDPAKKSLFDAELRIATSASSAGEASPFSSAAKVSPFPPGFATGGDPFWTACTSCCHVHQYPREYAERSLRCPTCRRAFVATELSLPPPTVPGTDMYYCSWGFFPLGFLGGPNFFGSSPGAPLDLNSEWKPFYPMFPSQPSNNRPDTSVPPQDEHAKAQAGRKQNDGVDPQPAGPETRNRKRMAQKRVGGGVKKRSWNSGNSLRGFAEGMTATPAPEIRQGTGLRPLNDLFGEYSDGININEGFKSPMGDLEGHVDDSVNFHIDVDTTDEILGNLQNLPFLKDDVISLRLP